MGSSNCWTHLLFPAILLLLLLLHVLGGYSSVEDKHAKVLLDPHS